MIFKNSLFIVLFCLTPFCHAMQSSGLPLESWSYHCDKFQIQITKKGHVKSLTTQELNSIKTSIAKQQISQKKRKQLIKQILQFIKAPIIDTPRFSFVGNYTVDNYFFEKFSADYGEPTEQDCQIIAKWLKDNSEKKGGYITQIVIKKYDQYFSLQAVNPELFQKLATTQLREKALYENNLVAFVTLEKESCQDITEQGLSEAKIEFAIQKLKN
jgi:hypothetical protein